VCLFEKIKTKPKHFVASVTFLLKEKRNNF